MHSMTGYFEVEGDKLVGWVEATGLDGKSIAVCSYVVEKGVGLEEYRPRWAVAEASECRFYEVKRGSVRLKIAIPFSLKDGCAIFPPGLYRFPVIAGDPYTVFDVSLIVDSSPRFAVFGFSSRHSTVISSTLRTVLEGRQPLQLLVARSDSGSLLEAREWNEVVLEERSSVFFVYPVLSGDSVVDYAKLCEKMRGYSGWGRCLHEAASMHGAWGLLREFHSRFAGGLGFWLDSLEAYGLWLRLLDHIAFFQNVGVRELAERAVVDGVLPEDMASVIRVSRGVLVEPCSSCNHLRLRLLETKRDEAVLRDVIVYRRVFLEEHYGSIAGASWLCGGCLSPV